MPAQPSSPSGRAPGAPVAGRVLAAAQRAGRGDMDPEEFRRAAHATADLMADYLEGVEHYPVLQPLTPGELRPGFAAAAPEGPESMARILADYRRLVEPNVT